MNTSLHGKHVLVTRPQHQAAPLTQLIAQYGGEAIGFPTLEIVPVTNLEANKQQLKNLKTYQWLIFVSANAVNFAVAANNGKIGHLTQTKIAAVGKATAKALQTIGLTVDLLPETGFNSEALLASEDLQQVENQQVLIVRGVGGRETLADELKKRGAKVDYWQVYQRQIPVIDTAPVIALLKQQQLDILIITSAESLQNLIIMLEPNKSLLLDIPLVVISERIKQIAEIAGFKKIVVSSSPDDAAILNTMIMLTNGEDSG